VGVVATPVLDSDVLIDHLRDAGPGRELVDELVAGSGFWITAVTVFELALGTSYARDPAPANALLAVPCLTLTREAALRAGALLRELRSSGRSIDVRDAMQAGICLQADAPLVTRNVLRFSRVPGLQVTDPTRWGRRAT
jgi:predicted nucleic acid-binding protein